MQYFKVSFKYSDNVYCSNLARADSIETVEAHYLKAYEWVSVRVAYQSEVREARAKGMPILDFETV